MFWLIRKGIKLLILGVAVFGLAHVPIQGDPLWKYIQGGGMSSWDISKRVGKKKAQQWFKDMKQLILKAFKQEAKERENQFKRHAKKIQTKKKANRQKRILSRPKEMITASEEQKLEEILENNQR